MAGSRFAHALPHRTAQTSTIPWWKGNRVNNDTIHSQSQRTGNGETSSGPSLENVTREQGGQFIDEGQDLIRFGDPLDDMGEMDTDAHLLDSGAARINALQVTMDRSGAEFVHSQKAFLTNSGAKQINGTSSKLIQSGVLQLQTESAEFHQSSAVLAKAGRMSFDQGSVVFATADNVELGKGSQASVIQSRELKADGDVRAFMLFSKDVTAGGNVSSTLSTAGAAAFGAVFAVVFALLMKMVRRDDD
jgi:hypothetical protein